MTKEEKDEYHRKYVAEHREEINANTRYRYQKNPEVRDRQRKRMKDYYEKHKNDPEYRARALECSKRYQKKNRERINAKNREWYAKNRERIKAYHRERYRAKKEVEGREGA